jgi:hypothetical protein
VLTCKEKLKFFALAGIHVMLYGIAGSGKTSLLQTALLDLELDEQMDSKTIRMTKKTRPFQLQDALEEGFEHKLKTVLCPSAGKKAFLLLIEDLHLDDSSSIKPKVSCMERIRQFVDAKGSFLGATKEFVRFQHFLCWSTFSLSPFGYPKLTSRLLRHFQVMSMSDSSDQVYKRILSTFPHQLIDFLHVNSFSMENLSITSIMRICQFPIEFYKTLCFEKMFAPNHFYPQFLFSFRDLVQIFHGITLGAKKNFDSILTFEIFMLQKTLHIFKSRIVEWNQMDHLTHFASAIAKKLNFSSQSSEFLQKPHEYLFMDKGDGEGYGRIQQKTALSLFLSGCEKLQWFTHTTAYAIAHARANHSKMTKCSSRSSRSSRRRMSIGLNTLQVLLL